MGKSCGAVRPGADRLSYSSRFDQSVDDVVDRRLLHRPIAGIAVVPGQGEAMPILIVELHMITPVVIPRPTRFLAEQRVAGDGLRGQKPVVQLPRALKLVKVLGAHVANVL